MDCGEGAATEDFDEEEEWCSMLSTIREERMLLRKHRGCETGGAEYFESGGRGHVGQATRVACLVLVAGLT